MSHGCRGATLRCLGSLLLFFALCLLARLSRLAEPIDSGALRSARCPRRSCPLASASAELVATYWTGHQEDSWAAFRMRDDGSVVELESGQVLPSGHRVVAIERGRVALAREGVCEQLPVGQFDACHHGASRTVVPPTEEDFGARVRRRGDQSFETHWGLLDEAFADINQRRGGVESATAFDAAKATGFELRGVEQGGALSALGLRAGDIVREINGHAATSPELAVEALAPLRDARFITIDIFRDGEHETLSYELE